MLIARERGLDVVLASVQKAMAAPPGLTVFSFSDRAAEQAGRRAAAAIGPLAILALLIFFLGSSGRLARGGRALVDNRKHPSSRGVVRHGTGVPAAVLPFGLVHPRLRLRQART